MRRVLPITLTLAMCLTAVSALSAAVTFASTFKSLDAGATNFVGRKVAALVMSNDLGVRVPAEEAMVRELNARGIQGIATYKIVPRENMSLRRSTGSPRACSGDM